MDYIAFISAAGIGGIIGSLMTTVVQAWLSSKQLLSTRLFQEKKEAYIGYLEAGHKNEIQSTPATRQNWAYWSNRCYLVASSDVVNLLRKIEETDPVNGVVHPERLQWWARLQQAMRKDLGIGAGA